MVLYKSYIIMYKNFAHNNIDNDLTCDYIYQFTSLRQCTFVNKTSIHRAIYVMYNIIMSTGDF